MLSAGQLRAIENKTKIDGTPASAQHMNNVMRTVKVKIQEATADLEIIYQKVPELRHFIEKAMSWLPENNVRSKQVTEMKESAVPSDWPDDPSILPEYVPDKDKVFRSLNL